MTRRFGTLIAAAAWSAAAQSGGTINGRVVSSLHGEPVAGATVMLSGLESSDQRYVAQSGPDGRFSISHIVPGAYMAVPSKSGFEQRASRREATANDFPPIKVDAGSEQAIVVRLIPDGVVAGRVLDSDGDPVRRAQVELRQYRFAGGKKQLVNARTANTNDLGEYRLFHFPPGRYYLEAVPTNGGNQQVLRLMQRGAIQPEPQTSLAPAFYPGVPDAAHATEIEVAPGAEVDGIDFHLTPERLYSIRGKITADVPTERVNVRAENLSPDGGRRGGFPLNVQKGQYEISGLPPGRYVVIAQTNVTPQQTTEQQYAQENVDVNDRDVDHMDLSLAPGKTVKGVVQRAEGGALQPNITVTLTSENGPMFVNTSARVGADGTFKFDLPPGVYTPRVNGGQAYLKAVLAGSDVVPDRKIDTARLSGDLTLIVASDFGKVEGIVLDDSGKPVYNAYVLMVSPTPPIGADRPQTYTAYTKTNGKFNIDFLEPGDYKAFAWTGVEPGAPIDPDFRKPFEDRGVAVKVESNGKSALELKEIAGQ